MTSDADQKKIDAICAEMAKETLREMDREKKELERVFGGLLTGSVGEHEALEKLNNPHLLCNYISPDGEDDDDDFRPW